jgi:hypothetical protein
VLLSVLEDALLIRKMLQVAHFVRVLRTRDVTENPHNHDCDATQSDCDARSRLSDIVIVTLDPGCWIEHKVLRMFRGVYIVKVPCCDHGFVSVKTMKSINLQKAKHLVLTSSAAESKEETDKLDYHKMCLRMVIRPPRPPQSCLMFCWYSLSIFSLYILLL